MSLPLVGALGASLLPLHRWGQQVLILIVLVWTQVNYLSENFFVSK